MNNHEMNKHFPEIKKNKVDELWATLNNLKFEAYEEFEFDKKKFLLLPLEPEDVDEGGDAWFASSTAINGIDIYTNHAFY